MSSNQIQEYVQSDYVKSRIDTIVRRSAGTVTEQYLYEELGVILKDPATDWKDFKDDEQRHRFAVGRLISRYASPVATEDYEVLPVGYDGWRTTKKGQKLSNIFVLVSEGKDKPPKLRQIQGWREFAEAYKTIILGKSYVVKLSENPKNGMLGIENQTKFQNPQGLQIDPLNLYTDVIGTPQVPELAKAGDMPWLSKLQAGTEYVDSLDWKIVRGFVQGSPTKGKRDDGSEWGMYRLVDDSLSMTDRVDARTGKVRGATFPVYLDPGLMTWAGESEVYCVGSITISKKSQEPMMNGVNVLAVPGRGRPLQQ